MELDCWIEKQRRPEDLGVPVETWDISDTIPALSYLTHNYYRYYGKFPSAVGSRFIERYGRRGETLLDNYCGCGTSLVEASLAAMDSVGIDISPLGVLASRVKTKRWDLACLRRAWGDLDRWIKQDAVLTPESRQHSLAFDPIGGCSEGTGQNDTDVPLPDAKVLGKWFDPASASKLAALKAILLRSNLQDERAFFVLAFLSIIRRVSLAYDGEVRPHINPGKKPQDVATAYRRKVVDMLDRAQAYAELVSDQTRAEAYVGDNRDLSAVFGCHHPKFDVCLSHPPYLNCFDYFATFKLDLVWSTGFSEVWDGQDYDQLRKLETRAWPATNDDVVRSYFSAVRSAYSSVRHFLKPDGVCGIVIGDCTVSRRLVRVHTIVADICSELGYELEQVVYRTTHYGTGKYAYAGRADYHDDNDGKRDAILILRNRG